MAQRKQLSWTELRVGLFVLVGLLVLAVGIFYVTGYGFLGAKYRLYAYLPEVSGLANGAPVRLDGVEVGNVEAIRIMPRKSGQAVEKRRNVEVRMRIDSTASLVTEGLLGNRYVNISRGYTGVPIVNNGEVKGTEEKAIKEVVERSADVMANLQALSDDVRELIAGVQQGRGTLGKLLTDEQAYNHLNNVLAKSDQMVSNIQAGQGSLGKLVASDEIYQKANSAVGRMDTMMADIQAQKGSLGKLIYDESIYKNAKDAIEKSDALLTDVRAGKGTLGKLVVDDALYKNLKDTSAHLAAASAKLNENTTSAGKLFNDAKLYDNLAGLTGDLRLLVGDFRQNPKKFLHVKLAVF